MTWEDASGRAGVGCRPAVVAQSAHPPTLQHLHLPIPQRGHGPLQSCSKLVDEPRLDLHAWICVKRVWCEGGLRMLDMGRMERLYNNSRPPFPHYSTARAHRHLHRDTCMPLNQSVNQSLTDGPRARGLGRLDAHAPVPAAQVEQHLVSVVLYGWMCMDLVRPAMPTPTAHPALQPKPEPAPPHHPSSIRPRTSSLVT